MGIEEIVMLWVKAFHIIFVITWFSGLFYLPRLYVYHAMAKDALSIERFKLMERRLYYGIMMPSGLLTTFFGLWLLLENWQIYLTLFWMQAKLGLVILLWLYHLYLGQLYVAFKKDNNHHTHVFYRILNEVPTLLLIAIVILVIVKPRPY
jgi:putative membrane protein